MAEQPTYKLLPEDKCLTESQLFDYIDGKLKTSDMHFIEKHILSCGFCSDALDGLEKLKSREKVAAYIPAESTTINEEEKEEPKVIPLNPNRKYYALAAGIVLILGITLFLKLSTFSDLSQEKMAAVSDESSDSIVFIPEDKTEKTPAPEKSALLNESYSRTASGEATLKQSETSARSGYFKIAPPAGENYAAPPPPPKVSEDMTSKDQSVASDGDMMDDDFANVVDAKVMDEEQANRNDNSKKEKLAKPEQKQADADKYVSQEKAASKNDNQQLETGKENNTKDVPVTLSTTAPSSQGRTSQNVNSDYLYTTPTGGVTVTDSVTMYARSESERALDLSYENANKMLAAGQAAASIPLYDEVLKNPAHSHYQDAQWKKSEALIQLKRIDEAKVLLNEIASKKGKYKEQAKAKLKSM